MIGGEETLPYLTRKNLADVVTRYDAPAAAGSSASSSAAGGASSSSTSTASSSSSAAAGGGAQAPRGGAQAPGGFILTVGDLRQMSLSEVMGVKSLMWHEIMNLFDYRSVLHSHLRPFRIESSSSSATSTSSSSAINKKELCFLIFPKDHFKELPDLEKRVLDVDLPGCK